MFEMTSAKTDRWHWLVLDMLNKALESDDPRLITKALSVKLVSTSNDFIKEKSIVILMEIDDLDKDKAGSFHWWSLLRRIVDGDFGFVLGPIEEKIKAAFTKSVDAGVS